VHRYRGYEIWSEEETNEKEKSNQSITISGSFIEREDDYYKETIITSKLPSGQKCIHLRTRYDKIYNEKMEIMSNFIKKEHQKKNLEETKEQ
jgi:hypothetical protein